MLRVGVAKLSQPQLTKGELYHLGNTTLRQRAAVEDLFIGRSLEQKTFPSRIDGGREIEVKRNRMDDRRKMHNTRTVNRNYQ